MRKHAPLILVGVLLAAGLATLASAQAERGLREGSKPYTPTRLEWLVVQLNAEDPGGSDLVSGMDLSYVALADQDAILIYVRYYPSVDRELMNSAIDFSRKYIGLEAKSRGWDSWLTVKENVQRHRSAR